MKIRKTIAMEKEDYEALEPLLRANKGNFSKAIRGLIKERSGGADIRERIKKSPLTPEEIERYRKELRNLMVEHNLGWLNPPSYLVWALQAFDGVVPPMGIFRNTFDRIFPELFGVEKVTIKAFADYVNTLNRLTGPGGLMHITYDSPVNPAAVKIHYEMQSPGNIMMFAKAGSHMAAHRPLLLKPISVTKTQTYADVEYTPAASEEEAYKALVRHFGHNQKLFDEIMKNQNRWNELLHVSDHFTGHPSTLDHHILLEILKGDSPSQGIASICEKMLGSSLSEAPLEEVVSALEKLGRTAGIIKNTELGDSEIKIYLSFSDRAVQELIARCFTEIISQTGREYTVEKSFSNWFILRPLS